MLPSCPFSLGRNDERCLRWVDGQAKTNGEWPTIDALLIEFGEPRPFARRLADLGLVKLRADHILLTPNGLRILGGVATELDALRRLITAAREHWQKTRTDAEVGQLASVAGVDPVEAQRLLSMAPVGFDATHSGFATQLSLGDYAFSLDAAALTVPEWVVEPPTTCQATYTQLAHARGPIQAAVYSPFMTAPVIGGTLSGGTLVGGCIAGIEVQSLSGRGATLEELNVSGTRFVGCDFSDATFRCVSAGNTYFEGCHFIGAQFDSCELNSAFFRNCDFDETSADQVLSVAKWERARVGDATYESGTWPPPESSSPTPDASAEPEHEGRLQLRELGDRISVRFDGKELGSLDPKEASTRALLQLFARPGQTLQVLDVDSLTLGHEIHLEDGDKTTYEKMANSLGITSIPAGEPTPLQWSLLRRLEVLRRPRERKRRRRANATTVDKEAAAISAALEDATYVPKKAGGDPVAQASNRLRLRLKTAVEHVEEMNEAAANYLSSCITRTLETVTFAEDGS